MQSRYISSFGVGEDDAKAAGKVFPRLIADELAIQYSWGGTAHKSSFKELVNIHSTIFNVICKEIPHYTQLRYDKSAKTWIRHADERIKKRILKGNLLA